MESWNQGQSLSFHTSIEILTSLVLCNFLHKPNEKVYFGVRHICSAVEMHLSINLCVVAPLFCSATYRIWSFLSHNGLLVECALLSIVLTLSLRPSVCIGQPGVGQGM